MSGVMTLVALLVIGGVIGITVALRNSFTNLSLHVPPQYEQVGRTVTVPIPSFAGGLRTVTIRSISVGNGSAPEVSVTASLCEEPARDLPRAASIVDPGEFWSVTTATGATTSASGPFGAVQPGHCITATMTFPIAARSQPAHLDFETLFVDLRWRIPATTHGG